MTEKVTKPVITKPDELSKAHEDEKTRKAAKEKGNNNKGGKS